MRSNRRTQRTRALTVLTVATGVALTAATPAPAAHSHAATWTQTWGAAMQRPAAGSEDTGANWSVKGFAEQSLRQVVRLSAGGSRLRIRLSNRYGDAPLRIAGATVARAGKGAVIRSGSVHTLRFDGARTTTVAPGREAVSDAARLRSSALERVTVTLRFAARTGPATFHRFTTATSYRAPGDRLADTRAKAFQAKTHSWYYLTGVDVAGGGAARRGTLVVIGDSVSDGVGSTPGDHRYTDRLAERLAAAHRPMGIVNGGIAGGKLLHDSLCYGESGVARLERDVIDRPGVRSVVLELGLNDIGAPQQEGDRCAEPNPRVSARQLIAGYKRLSAAAHARDIKVLGVTMIPMKTARFPFYSAWGERVRLAFNDWVRETDTLDGFADFDRAMADPGKPDHSLARYLSIDGGHPNDAGYRALAETFNLASL